MLGAMVALAFAPNALAATLRVNNGSAPGACPATYATIQAAVNAAASGDTVLVCQGTYSENVVVSTPGVTIKGKNLPPDLSSCKGTRTSLTTPAAVKKYTIVEGPGGVRAFDLEADDVALSNLVIQNTPSDTGAVFTSPSFSGYDIQQNLIQDNTFGIYFNSSGANKSTIAKNCFRENTAPGAVTGTAVYSDQGVANALIQANRLFGHQPAPQEGGGFVFDGVSSPTDLTVQGNTSVNDNTFMEFYAGVFDSSFTGNVVKNVGLRAFFFKDASGVKVSSNILTGSATDANGIVFRLFITGSTDVSVTNNIFTNVDRAAFVAEDFSLFDSLIRGNVFRSINGDGIVTLFGNSTNTFQGNVGKGKRRGCHDESLGAGTAGTDNTWSGNIGPPASFPLGICFPNKVDATNLFDF